MKNACVVVSLTLCCMMMDHGVMADDSEFEEPRSYGASHDNIGPISAPVTYKDTMLIVTTAEGTAAIIFDHQFERGTKYRFRYLKKGSLVEAHGDGTVFEKYADGKYDGGKLTIVAEAIRIGWSDGGETRGWIYYQPETTSVHLASAERFADRKDGPLNRDGVTSKAIDLTRFFRK